MKIIDKIQMYQALAVLYLSAMVRTTRGYIMAALLLFLGYGQSAYAVTDYTGITTAVDFSGVITGILAVAALIAAVLVVKRGVKMLLGMIGR